jgi:chromate transporter
VAFVALWRFKIDILKVIGASAAVGLVYTYLV